MPHLTPSRRPAKVPHKPPAAPKEVAATRANPPQKHTAPPVQSGVQPSAKPAGVSLPAPTVATLTGVSGDVTVRPPGGAFRKAVEGERIGANWQVASYDGGKVRVQFNDKSVVDLEGNGLLIVYANAKRSQRSTTPPKIEMNQAEVKQGLAALRGD